MIKYLFCAVLTCVISCLFGSNFTPGNIVIVRVGDGTAAPSNASTAVFLDEYTASGSLVQSIAVPTSVSGSNHALTLSGKANTEGALTLSANNEYLSFVGFDTTTGYANVSTGVTNRTVAMVGANGVVNTTTGFYAGSAYVTDNFRGAVTTDGTGFWCAGAGTGATGGTWYIPFGSFTSSATQVNATVGTTRAVNVFDGQLYFTANSSGTPVPGLFSLGTGAPTTANQTAAILPGISGSDSVASPYAFFFCQLGSGNGENVVYICDDEVAAPLGGIYKFSLVNGTWVSNGNITNVNGLRGIAAYKSCSGVNMFLTAQNALFTFSDNSGYNQPIAGSLVQIATPATNTVFRGVAFTPGTIPPGALEANTSVTDVSCHGLTNGSITLSLNQGSASNYTYAWSDGSVTTENRNNLAAGNYTVTITGSGCSATASATISQPLILSVTSSVTNVSCNGGNNGAITLHPAGGTTPYSWTPANLTNLSSGTYDITVTDTNSCSVTAAAQVTQPNAIVITDTLTNLPCTGGGNTGAVNIGVTGGTAGYTYLWSNTNTTEDIANQAAGTYTVTVTDAAHCTATLTAILSHSGNLTVNPIVSEISCYGLSNGSISLTPSGGTGPYNYTWGNSDTGHLVSNLLAGNYVVTITDQSGCTLISSVVVSQPTQLTAGVAGNNVSCYGAANGVFAVLPAGGTSPYTFSNDDSSEQNLAPGIYSVTVSDNNGCSVIASDTIWQPDSLSLQLTVTNATSLGADNGSVALTVSGGTAVYAYDWSNGNATQNDSNLVAASYCVIVTDQNSCIDSACATVSETSGIEQTEWMEKLSAYTAGSNLVINVVLKNEMRCAVQLFDITGNLVISNPPVLTSNLNLQWPDASFSPGCYLVRVTTDAGLMSRKIVIVK